MNTGGPAFPVPVSDATDGRTHDGGMTLLDWFAGQALVGLIDFYAHHDVVTVDDIAVDAYNNAAAMLAEKARREATGKQDLQVQDHSGDANKMVEDHFRGVTEMTNLEAQNRELVERVKRLEQALSVVCGGQVRPLASQQKSSASTR